MDIDEQKRLLPAYVGQSSDIFWLGFKTTLLTFVTLGIYRFWAKTRVRNFIWSSVRVEGDRAEYTGTGLEKLLGFLIAVVVLAIYLGLIQLLLTFAGYSLFSMFDPNMSEEEMILRQVALTYVVLIALLPLIFFAQYRARRYMMSRSRWRGLRFGMDKGAGGYTWRAIMYYIISGISLGILTPLATFRLAKYKNDRSWYGDAKFAQGGQWTKLYGAMKHIFFGIGLIVMGVIFIAVGAGGLGAFVIFVAYFWLIVGSIYYRVHAHRYLMANVTLDGAITFLAEPKTGTVIKHYILGSLLVGAMMLVAFIPALVLVGVMGALADSGSFAGMGVAGFAVALAYLAAIAVSVAGSLAFITQPILAHFVTTTTIMNADHLNTIQQRAGDSMPDADGFADALDIGAAF